MPDRLASAALAAGAPPIGSWSAQDVVRHLIAVEAAVWQARLDSLSGTELPHWSWTEPGLAARPAGEAIDGAIDAFRVARHSTIDRLAALDSRGWARFGTHDSYGRLDVAGLVAVALDHDAEHLRQIVALGIAPDEARP